MTLMPELEETPEEQSARLIRAQADLVHARARWMEAAGIIGGALFFGVVAYLWFDLRSGWNVHPTWQPAAGAVVGALLGFGLCRPFAEWLRLQARLALIQIDLEVHARETSRHSALSAQRMNDIQAGLTGEWNPSWSGRPLDDSLD